MSIDRKTLAEAGQILVGGPEWKRPLAKILGPLHPSGARESLDPRLPFRWAAEPNAENRKDNSRPIPSWVGPALVRLLDEKAQQHLRDADAARALANRLKGE